MEKYIEQWNQLQDIHFLQGFEPEETRYARFAENEPSLIATGHKIIDFYQAFARARAMLLYSLSENWGDISPDTSSYSDTNIIFPQSQMIIAAILEYALCLDMCWQIIWAYFQPLSLKLLLQDYNKTMEEYCTSIAVHQQLNCAIAQHGVGSQLADEVKNCLTDLENDISIMKIRELYNMIKHRGILHIEGLGMNDNRLGFTVNGKTIPKLNRTSYKIEELIDFIFLYDKRLSDFIIPLINKLIPADYLTTKCDLGTLLSAGLEFTSAT